MFRERQRLGRREHRQTGIFSAAHERRIAKRKAAKYGRSDTASCAGEAVNHGKNGVEAEVEKEGENLENRNKIAAEIPTEARQRKRRQRKARRGLNQLGLYGGCLRAAFINVRAGLDEARISELIEESIRHDIGFVGIAEHHKIVPDDDSKTQMVEKGAGWLAVYIQHSRKGTNWEEQRWGSWIAYLPQVRGVLAEANQQAPSGPACYLREACRKERGGPGRHLKGARYCCLRSNVAAGARSAD